MNIYIDGECRPNPGKGRSVVVVEDKKEGLIKLSKKLEEVTNNIAEYQAFILAIEYLKKNVMNALSDGKVIIYTDSKLIWGQLIKGWNVKSNKELVNEAKKLFNDVREVGINLEVRWIPREKNIAGIMIENGDA